MQCPPGNLLGVQRPTVAVVDELNLLGCAFAMISTIWKLLLSIFQYGTTV
jgi:hypothetical protein